MPHSLIEMLKYMRPEGSNAQKEFCQRFIEPIMGKPDRMGNYVTVVGDEPKIAFMAHHDTVHNKGGKQILSISEDIVMSDADCLGADCTTGVWIILNMIWEEIPGVYVIHAAEEVGCKGSSYTVKQNPLWLDHVDVAISFDRKGYSPIVTHQVGIETCSQAFAESLSDVLGLGMDPDDTGVYTDSNEYRGVIAECTNISVGYFNQHTSREYQDMSFAYLLLERVLGADWSKVVVERNPDWFDDFNSLGLWSSTEEDDRLVELCQNYPRYIAEMLESYGLTAADVEEELFGMTGRMM